ncbi:glycoside hydrolase family 25 protein [Streptomyces sp. NBC_00996]|uniref:glycoside hydrolase family 25 protein n=1 Tax=Streptomyces sp. NBC_00996 TaxID=2903710 RepID=UPI00386EAA7F|nr:glycoside hydrolase family 25 protein [Streptomyces sp. NBC_00996]
MATCRGVDVSAYQAVQDWGARKREGVVFAFAKASEGQHSRDSRFATHITGIIAAGLIPGSYHFAWPNQDVGAEATNYIGAVRQYAHAHDYVHWLDLERYSDGRNYAGRSSAQILAWVKQWIAIVQDAFPGQRVGVYTSADDIAKGHVPAGVPIWYPAYPGTRVDTYTEAEAAAQPKPSGRSPLIWQFTSSPASGPRMDLNICYLSAAGLRAWAAGDMEDDVDLRDKVDLTYTDDGEKKLLWAGRLIDGKSEISVNYALACAAASLFYGKEHKALLTALTAKVDAQAVTIDKLVDAITAGPGADLEALKAEIRQAIEGISATVHLDIPES